MSEQEAFKSTVADVFGRAATTYDRVGTRFFTYFGQKLVDYAEVPAGARVLDVATGRGASLFPAAQKVGPHGEVIGIDITPEMVEETAQDIQAMGIQNARTMEMDAENLNFPDNSFDRVLCGFAIFFMPNPYRALTEFRRVLKPGGLLALSSWTEDTDSPWSWDAELMKKYSPPPAPKQIEQSLGSYKPSDFEKPEAIKAFIEAMGFEGVEVRTEELAFAYKDAQEWWNTRWSHFSRYDMERMTPENLERYKTEAFAKIREMMEPDGLHTVDRALFTRATRPAR